MVETVAVVEEVHPEAAAEEQGVRHHLVFITECTAMCITCIITIWPLLRPLQPVSIRICITQ